MREELTMGQIESASTSVRYCCRNLRSEQQVKGSLHAGSTRDPEGDGEVCQSLGKECALCWGSYCRVPL